MSCLDCQIVCPNNFILCTPIGDVYPMSFGMFGDGEIVYPKSFGTFGDGEIVYPKLFGTFGC